jgi:DNA polymerase III subunit gamma/tau
MLRTFDELNYRQEPRFHLELGLLKLVHMQRLIPLEQLMSQLPAGGTRSVAPARQPSSAPPPNALQTRATSTDRSSANSPSLPASHSAAPAGASPFRNSGNVAPSSAPSSASEQPAVSPFEVDSRRKRTEAPDPRPDPRPEAKPDAKGTAASFAPHEFAPPEVAKLESPLAAAAAVAVIEAPPLLRPEPPEPQPDGHMTPEEERREAEAEEEIASDSPGLDAPLEAQAPELDHLRNAVAAALDERGHNTAAALLTAGQWTLAGDTLVVAAGVKKMMLGLTMNPEAERIAKKALLDAGCTWKLSVVPGERGPGERGPGEGGASQTGARPAPVGSIQAQALDNPLVRQAQDLFRAEVRSVLDLRDKDLRDKGPSR